MPSTTMKSGIIPVSPKKRYRFFIEWVASGTSDALTCYARWFDDTQSTLATWSFLSETATVANAWQTSSRSLVPPEDARYVQIAIAKPNVATKFGIARLEFKEFDNSLERKLREISLIDDFCSTNIGQLPWTRYDMSGTVIASKVEGSGTFGQWSEFGITRLTTGVSTGFGGNIHLERLGEGPPPIGTEFRCKVRMQDTTNILAWVGIWSRLELAPDTALANVVEGIGFRAEATGSGVNWFGVVRDQTTEATVDMGVAANTTWRNLGFYITNVGVQFTLRGTAVGAEVTSVIPQSATQLAPIVGLLTQTNSAKEMDIDFYGLQIFLNRL